jgi:hypothetical protein
MENLKRVIRSIDLFATSVDDQLTVNKKHRISTVIGGVFGLVMIFAISGFTLLCVIEL